MTPQDFPSLLASWLSSLCHGWRNGRPTESGVTCQTPPGCTDERIWAKGSQRGRTSQAVWERQSLPCDGYPIRSDLKDEIEKAVGEILCSLKTRARLLDSARILEIALRLNDRAILETDQNRYQLAEALWQRSLDIFEKIAVPDHPQLAEVLENYARLLRRIGRDQQAGPLEDRAAAIRAGNNREAIMSADSIAAKRLQA